MFSIAGTDKLEEIVGEGNDSDSTDALIAGLTGLAYLRGLPGWDVRRPNDSEREAAKTEGWIFFPMESSQQRPSFAGRQR